MTTRNQQSAIEPPSRATDHPSDHPSDDRPPVEALLEVLVDPARRQILETLRLERDGQFIDSLLESGAGGNAQTRSASKAALYHKQLPKLEDVGLVEIDWDRKLIYYRPDARIEALLDTVSVVSAEWQPVEQPRPGGRGRAVGTTLRRLVRSLGGNR